MVAGDLDLAFLVLVAWVLRVIIQAVDRILCKAHRQDGKGHPLQALARLAPLKVHLLKAHPLKQVHLLQACPASMEWPQPQP